MKAFFAFADGLHKAVLFIAGLALVTITVIIPYGVFTRYVLNSASSWPEPLSVVLMIVISFLSAIICYREHLHIGVGMLPAMLKGNVKIACGVLIELCMLATNLFLLVYGIKLVKATWYQSLAEFPSLPAGLTYLPVVICGAVSIVFVIERFLKGNYFPEQSFEDDLVSSE
jgi:TRAP-type C4-dicarboxylate transport system permease small subunit